MGPNAGPNGADPGVTPVAPRDAGDLSPRQRLLSQSSGPVGDTGEENLGGWGPRFFLVPPVDRI